MRLCQITAALLGLAPCVRATPPVRLSEDPRSFRMDNGRLAVTVDKATGRLSSARLDGRELFGKGGGYWSLSGGSAGGGVDGFGGAGKAAATENPAANGGARAGVVCRLAGTGRDGSFPGKVELHYVLERGSTALHLAAVLSHGPGDAPFGLGEGRFVAKLDGKVFNHLSVDRDRDRDMPSGDDWDRGQPTNLAEARRLTTGKWAGTVEHKYAYSAILADIPAYGWCGTLERFGVWMINPAIEYLAGGPAQMELTGHLDVGRGGAPTLLNMWHGSHYGGTVLRLARDESWTRVIGPFALYFNTGGSPAEMWRDARARAARERAAWPFAWFRHPAYPGADARGGVVGRIRVAGAKFPQAMRVGLTAPDESVRGRRGEETVDWQRDGKHYQYWTCAGAGGAFTLSGVRPGTYVLRAYADGEWGEYARANVTVRAGEATALGDAVWTPVAAGPVLWQIGVPDRGAAEFRNGDRYWQWGNYFRVAEDFPRGVDYVVGASDWRRDWNVCQPLALAPDGRVTGDSVWTVRFPLEKAPAAGAVLRVGFCGSREGARWSASCNGRLLAPAEAMPADAVMHRDSYRGHWFERVLPVPAGVLQAGENVIRFRLQGTVWHQGVLYDCIRFEAVAPPAAAAQALMPCRSRDFLLPFRRPDNPAPLPIWLTKTSPIPPAWRKSFPCANAEASFSKLAKSTAASTAVGTTARSVSS